MKEGSRYMNGENNQNTRYTGSKAPQDTRRRPPAAPDIRGGGHPPVRSDNRYYGYTPPRNGRYNGAPPRRYPSRRGPNRGNRAAAAIISVLMLVIAVSVVVSVRSCVNNRSAKAPVNTGTGESVTADNTENLDTEEGGSDMIVGTASPKVEGKLRVCVDPGHGYDDVGTSHANLGDKTEKDINLAVALKLVPLLQYEGYDVIMTRDSDTPPDYLKANENGQYLINPKWRSEFANKNDVDLYISLHCNSFDSSSTSGVRLYYCSDSTYGSKSFADKLASAIASTLNISLPIPTGYEYANAFVVTKLVKAPSVLVEMGFVTNEGDARLLLDDNWQTQMAQSLAKGIKEYLSSGNSGQ